MRAIVRPRARYPAAPVRHRTLLSALLLVLALAACGGDDEKEAASTPAPTATATPDPTDLKVKPEVLSPGGDPPARLVKEDVVPGKGKRAAKGDQVTVQYVGVSYSTGQQFDASWDSGQPFPFTLGEGQVIPGWDEGVAGMRVGGRRRLTIPPDMAYGSAGSPPSIGPDETLIFVVDLVDVA